MMVTLNYGEGEVRYLSDRDVEELNHVRLAIQQALSTKLNNAGIYFHSMSRVKTESSIKNKLAKGKYSSDGGGKKIQDLIGIRINLFYSEDIGICESILEDTFKLDNWSKSENGENRFEAQKCNGVFKIPSKYLRNISSMIWEQPFDQTFEVQLRTILFEGWHEIEHEMRYKYKLGNEAVEDDLWTGQEKLSRVMNSIIANLELCDWSIVQIFDSICKAQLEEKNWENAIRSKYRLRITQDHLKPELREYFDNNPDIVKRFHNVTKRELVNILLNKKYHKELTPDRVIYLINKEQIHDEYISKLLDKEQFVRVSNKEIRQEIKPLVSDNVFSQNVYIPVEGYEKACTIIYDWAYQHMKTVFNQMPEKMANIGYETIGYKLRINYDGRSFMMDVQQISNDEPGVIWHTTAELMHIDGRLLLSARNTCETIYSRERRYSRPKFMKDIFYQIGFIDGDIQVNDNTGISIMDYRSLIQLIKNENRNLPIIVMIKPDVIPEWAIDCDGYIIRADMLSKTLNGLSHVAFGDSECKRIFQEEFGKEAIDGAVMYWGMNSNYPVIFSMEDINHSFFEEVSHSINEDIEYEKSFRYSLREMVCDEYVK